MPLFQNTATRIEEGNFEHEYAERIVRHLCECLEQLNQFDPSEVWRRKWLAAVNEKDGPDSVKYATALTSLGSTLLQQQKWSEAESVLRASLAIRERQAVQTWTSSNTRSMIGGALLGQQDFANAEPLLLQGYSGLKERESEIPSEAKILLTQAVERLVQLYDAWGQAEKAAEWRVKLDAQK